MIRVCPLGSVEPLHEMSNKSKLNTIISVDGNYYSRFSSNGANIRLPSSPIFLSPWSSFVGPASFPGVSSLQYTSTISRQNEFELKTENFSAQAQCLVGNKSHSFLLFFVCLLRPIFKNSKMEPGEKTLSRTRKSLASPSPSKPLQKDTSTREGGGHF